MFIPHGIADGFTDLHSIRVSGSYPRLHDGITWGVFKTLSASRAQ
jgi:hypothetical protein